MKKIKGKKIAKRKGKKIRRDKKKGCVKRERETVRKGL